MSLLNKENHKSPLLKQQIPQSPESDTGSGRFPWTFSWTLRILSFFTACTLMLICGSPWSFGTYSEALKDTLSLRQSELTFIQTASTWGYYVAYIPGAFYEHFGPKWSALMTILLCSGGYLILWASVSGLILSNYLLLSFAYFILGQGSMLMYLMALLVTMKNFPEKFRGTVVSVLDGCCGASSLIVSAVYTVWTRSHTDRANLSAFLLMISVVSLVISLIALFCLRQVGTEGFDEEEEDQMETKKHSFISLVSSYRFHVIFWSDFLVSGTLLMFISDISSIIGAFHGTQNKQNTYSMVTFAASTFSRLTMGTLSDVCIHTIPRPVFLQFTLLLGCIAFALLLISQETFILAAAVLAGIAYGGFASMYPLITADEFGLDGFGYTWGYVMLSTPVANLAFQFLSGSVYDDHCENGSIHCYGDHCYQLTFVISFICCVFGFAVSLLLLKRLPKNVQMEESETPLSADFHKLKGYSTFDVKPVYLESIK